MKARMVPVGPFFRQYGRVVRDPRMRTARPCAW